MTQTRPSDVVISRKDFVNRRDATKTLEDLAPRAVRDLLEGLAGDQVTVTVIPSEEQRLLVAVADGDAFIGLEDGENVFQFARYASGDGLREMVIEGQDTQLESCFVLTVREAAAAVHDWLSGEEPSSIGEWVQM